MQNLIFQLHSVVEPIDVAELFPKSQPLEVELGCGDASFLVEYAKRNLEINFIGVERLLGRIAKLDKKGRRMELQNLRGVRIESAYFLKFLLPRNSARTLHIYFPDPWPKKRHHKNRLINETFPVIVRNVLAPNGKIYLRTDDKNYFQQMTEVFAADKNFTPIETPVELAELKTDFEKEFFARGINTLRAAYRRD